MREINVGIIGTGFIGPAHIEALRRLGNINIAALADIDIDTAKVKAENLNIKKYYGDYKELLKDDSIEVVHICTPNHLHYQMAKDALEADRHVICEKPLAIKIEEALELVELAEKKKKINAVHFNVRYYPLMRQVKMMVQKEDIGRIFSIHGSYLQDWLYYETDYNWRLESDLSGKSRAVADIGSHWMDLIEYISGLRINEVFADFATFFKVRKKPLKPVETYTGKILKPEDYKDIPIDTEDYASVLIRFDKDAKGVMTVSQVSAGRKNRIYFEMDGSKRSVAWESENPNKLWIGRRDYSNEEMMKDPSLVYPEVREIINYPGGHNEAFPDTSKQLFKEVYRDIKNNKISEKIEYPTFRDGLRELALCEAILESNKTEKWVRVKKF